ncbi:hypothetical protein PVAP13_1NG210900 [Panicum virgatum]|uniref:Uncharacterized protein n=1 Tax=Panicum virgatum TaxID=38727 RepID=A0A8T0WZV6_PANVG|nr:hypothetical protein PVAP13_1NG210900 [Panicum virgatum]
MGFISVILMDMWDSKQFHHLLCLDARVLRKWLVIDLLKWLWNESNDNIPEDIAGALKTICNTCVEKYI